MKMPFAFLLILFSASIIYSGLLAQENNQEHEHKNIVIIKDKNGIVLNVDSLLKHSWSHNCRKLDSDLAELGIQIDEQLLKGNFDEYLKSAKESLRSIKTDISHLEIPFPEINHEEIEEQIHAHINTMRDLEIHIDIQELESDIRHHFEELPDENQWNEIYQDTLEQLREFEETLKNSEFFNDVSGGNHGKAE